MPKHRPGRVLFTSTLKARASRVLFAVLGSLPATPVISYTRVDVPVRAQHVARVSRRLRPVAVSAVLGLALVVSLGVNLAKPQQIAAATSDNVNFQARLEGADGAIATDGNYNVQFKLYNAASGGSALWTETYLNSASQGVRVVNGYLTVNLGSVTAFPSNMAWDQNLYVTMNIGGTSAGAPSWDGEMNPRLKLTAVPYAFQAKNATQLQATNGANVATL